MDGYAKSANRTTPKGMVAWSTPCGWTQNKPLTRSQIIELGDQPELRVGDVTLEGISTVTAEVRGRKICDARKCRIGHNLGHHSRLPFRNRERIKNLRVLRLSREMRETVKEYETKVETVEKEHERVLCDVCMNECTDNHEVVPQELCSECQPDEEEQEWTMSEYRDAFQNIESNSNIEMGWDIGLLFTTLFPIFALAALLDAMENAENSALWFLLGAAGLSLWITIVLAVFTAAAHFGFVL